MSLDDHDLDLLAQLLTNLRHHVIPGGGWMHTTRLTDGTHDTAPVVAWLIDSNHNLREDMPTGVYGVPLINDEPCGLLHEATGDGAVWHPDEPTPPAWVVDYLDHLAGESKRLEERRTIQQQIRDAAHELDTSTRREGGGDMPRPRPAPGSKGARDTHETKFRRQLPNTAEGVDRDQ
jgi:hypothetical protein